MNNEEQRIRELAYQIWENEGRPEGKTEHHWALARELVESESRGDLAATDTKPKRARKTATRTQPAAETPALLAKPRKVSSKAPPSDGKTPRKTRKQLDQ